MENLKALKLFISYSHKDESYIEKFITHLSPLKRNNYIQEWYDRKIISGQDFQKTIDNNLINADIICLCISANFIASEACMKELYSAFELKMSKDISIVPIILSECGWLDIKELKSILAVPTDGKALSLFSDINNGLTNIYNGLKSIIEFKNKLFNAEFTESFQIFLSDSEMLSKAHSKKHLSKLMIFMFTQN